MSDTRRNHSSTDLDNDSKLSKLKQKYKTIAKENPHILRNKIPVADLWRFFVEAEIQRFGRGLNNDPAFNEARKKYGTQTIEGYITSLNSERDEPFEAWMKAENLNFLTYQKYLRGEITVSTPPPPENPDPWSTNDLEYLHLSKFSLPSLKQRYTLDDLALLDKGLTVFEYNEPGYLKALYSAFDSMLQPSFSSLDILSKIKAYHKISTEEVLKESHITPGKFRKSDEFFFNLKLNTTCSQQGIEAICRDNKAFLSFKITEKGVTSWYQSLDSTSFEQLLPYFNDRKKYRVSLQIKGEKEDYIYIENEMMHLIKTYESAIKSATTDLDKLKAIVAFVQDAEQLHPFADGNCRTFCMLLLNDLLIMNGFPFSMISNPNMFDGYTREELLTAVIDGMSTVFQLIEQPNNALFGVITNNIVEDLKKINQPEIKTMLAYISQLNEMEMLNRLNTSKLVQKPSSSSSTMWQQPTSNQTNQVSDEKLEGPSTVKSKK